MTNGIANLGKGTVVWEAGEAGNFSTGSSWEVDLNTKSDRACGVAKFNHSCVDKTVTIFK